MTKRAEALAATGLDSEKQDAFLKTNSKKSVYIYVAALFLIVLLFILLSYFIQQRNNSQVQSLNEKNITAQQNIENLQEKNLQLQQEIDAYHMTINELEAQILELEDQIKDIRQQWQNDVRDVKANDAAQYDELLAKYNELLEKYEVKES